jgi:plastocyanin
LEGSSRNRLCIKNGFVNDERSVKNVKGKRFLAVILAVFLAASAAVTQVRDAGATTTRNFTLYGAYLRGWGFTSSNITSPGPTIVVEQGDTVNLTLIGVDGVTHRFFVSYTNASSANSTEPQSPDFTTTIGYLFVATSVVGTYTYGCYYHYSVGMKGYFQVVPTGTIPEFQPLMLLSLLLASVAGAALVCRRKRWI